MSRRIYKNRIIQKIGKIFMIVFILTAVIGIGYANISSGLGISGILTLLGYNSTLTITLDNQNATIPGTTELFEKYSNGFYLDLQGQFQMTTSSYAITIPQKSGVIFDGYYTNQNGQGIQFIDDNGFLTGNADNTYFITGGKLYAKWAPQTPTPEITICKETSNNNNQDVFSFHIVSGSSYETWVELKNGECETLIVDSGAYQITEIDKIGYTINSITGLSANGGVLNATKNKEYTITFVSDYAVYGYFYNYGNTKGTLGGL